MTWPAIIGPAMVPRPNSSSTSVAICGDGRFRLVGIGDADAQAVQRILHEAEGAEHDDDVQRPEPRCAEHYGEAEHDPDAGHQGQ